MANSMTNALSNLANSLFNSRNAQQNQPRTTAPNPGMLGTGLASNAATGLLARQYQQQAAIAQANGEEFPSFEEWMLQRR